MNIDFIKSIITGMYAQCTGSADALAATLFLLVLVAFVSRAILFVVRIIVIIVMTVYLKNKCANINRATYKEIKTGWDGNQDCTYFRCYVNSYDPPSMIVRWKMPAHWP